MNQTQLKVIRFFVGRGYSIEQACARMNKTTNSFYKCTCNLSNLIRRERDEMRALNIKFAQIPESFQAMKYTESLGLDLFEIEVFSTLPIRITTYTAPSKPHALNIKTKSNGPRTEKERELIKRDLMRNHFSYEVGPLPYNPKFDPKIIHAYDNPIGPIIPDKTLYDCFQILKRVRPSQYPADSYFKNYL